MIQGYKFCHMFRLTQKKKIFLITIILIILCIGCFNSDKTNKSSTQSEKVSIKNTTSKITDDKPITNKPLPKARPVSTPTATPAPTPNPTAIPLPVPAPVKVQNDPNQIVNNAILHLNKAESAKYKMEIKLKTNFQNSEILIPMEISGIFKQNGGSQSEIFVPLGLFTFTHQIITKNGKSYISDPSDNKFYPLRDDNLFTGNISQFLNIFNSDSEEFSLDPNVNLLNSSEYQLTGSFSSLQSESLSNIKTEILVDSKNNQFNKITLAGKVKLDLIPLPFLKGLENSYAKFELSAYFSNFGIETQITLPDLTHLGKQFDSYPKMSINPENKYSAIIHMENGDQVSIELYAKKTPLTVNNFVFLARDGYYDNIIFHRIIPGFVAQTGDPTGTGKGDTGYEFDNEFHPSLKHNSPGIVSMANSGLRKNSKGTNGSQFFITYRATPHLDGYNPDGSKKDCKKPNSSCHTVFGKVISGMNIIEKLSSNQSNTNNDKKIRKIEIVEEKDVK